jgi:hypothetical protein
VIRVDRLCDAIDGSAASPDDKVELLKNLNKAVAKLDAADNDTLLLDEQYKEQRNALNDLAEVEDILKNIGDDGLRESVAVLALEIAEESYKQATLLDPARFSGGWRRVWQRVPRFHCVLRPATQQSPPPSAPQTPPDCIPSAELGYKKALS